MADPSAVHLAWKCLHRILTIFMREFNCFMFLYTSFGDHLRWYRMVWQRLVLGYTFKQIGANLGVDTATVLRTVGLFESTGSLEKRRKQSGKEADVYSRVDFTHNSHSEARHSSS